MQVGLMMSGVGFKKVGQEGFGLRGIHRTPGSGDQPVVELGAWTVKVNGCRVI